MRGNNKKSPLLPVLEYINSRSKSTKNTSPLLSLNSMQLRSADKQPRYGYPTMQKRSPSKHQKAHLNIDSPQVPGRNYSPKLLAYSTQESHEFSTQKSFQPSYQNTEGSPISPLKVNVTEKDIVQEKELTPKLENAVIRDRQGRRNTVFSKQTGVLPVNIKLLANIANYPNPTNAT